MFFAPFFDGIEYMDMDAMNEIGGAVARRGMEGRGESASQPGLGNRCAAFEAIVAADRVSR